MLRGIAIDAGWLRSLDEAEEDLFERIAFLDALNRRMIPLLLDRQGAIMAEYSRNLRPHSIGRKFVSLRLRVGPVQYHDGRPTNRCRSALKAILFDSDDLPYIGVAQRCHGGAYLTHETKHRRSEVKELVYGVAAVHVGEVPDLSILIR